MEGKRLIHSIKLTNLLSFGPDGMEVELQPLNVLIGANGSGKSNFIEVFRLLQAAPNDLTQPFRGVGANEWLWKGYEEDDELTTASCEVLVSGEHFNLFPRLRHSRQEFIALRHSLDISSMSDGRLIVVEENVREEYNNTPNKESFDLFHKSGPNVTLMSRRIGRVPPDSTSQGLMSPQKINWNDLKVNQSILSQRNDPDLYPQLNYLSSQYQAIQFYADARLGRLTPARMPQDATLDPSLLFEDASNLALVLNNLQSQPSVKRRILERLKLFYERVEDFNTRVIGGTVQIYFQERGLQQTVPATRLSDGTLRFLCLLVILLHPSPPPLICIEEPELGMHPDIIGTIAELLVEASQRTQLIVTTHSDLLISKLTDIPEAVVVCDRTSKGTTLTRLDAEDMEGWLKDYSLGEIWLKGAIGGTRW